MTILAIDAGTTGVTAQLIAADSSSLGKGYSEFEQHFPQPGWVEHQPEQIWQATLTAVRGALASAGLTSKDVTAIGITNQRETVVLWNRETLEAPTNAIVWQDRRTADLLSDAKFDAARQMVREVTGLPLDPYFSSSKLLWIKRNLPSVWAAVEAGKTAIGTVDSYLVARISGGKAHITDASNASRTQLFNLETLRWDARLLELFEVPESALPTITSCYGHLADADPEDVIDITDTPEKFIPFVIETAHSRFPVTDGDKNDIIGILLAKDLLRYYAGEDFNVRDMLRPAVFVPESKRLNVLLKEFRSNRNHIAIVVDEYGGVAGMITIEDVLEQIVGDIDDEHDIDEEADNIISLDDGDIRIKGITEIEQLNEALGTQFAPSDIETVAGLVIQHLGRVPKVGELIEIDGIEFEVQRADPRQIHILLARQKMKKAD